MGSYTTHASLLARLADDGDPNAWGEFVDRYGRLVRGFAQRCGLQEADCDEVVSEVLASLSRSMPGFRYDPAKGLFRSYLKTVSLRTIQRKKSQRIGEVRLEEEGAATTDCVVDETWETEWRQYHLRVAMRRIEEEFRMADRLAFERYAIDGDPVARVSRETGLSVDQVYQAKSRILKRLSELIERQVREEG